MAEFSAVPRAAAGGRQGQTLAGPSNSQQMRCTPGRAAKRLRAKLSGALETGHGDVHAAVNWTRHRWRRDGEKLAVDPHGPDLVGADPARLPGGLDVNRHRLTFHG